MSDNRKQLAFVWDGFAESGMTYATGVRRATRHREDCEVSAIRLSVGSDPPPMLRLLAPDGMIAAVSHDHPILDWLATQNVPVISTYGLGEHFPIVAFAKNRC